MLGANGDFFSINLFTYCANNPVTKKDASGYAWDIIFDLVSFGFGVVDVVRNPKDIGAWAGCVGDFIDAVVPFFGGLGESIRAINAGRKISDAADDLHDAKQLIKTVHGNSLDYPGTNYGYVLSDLTTGEVVKFGESINPAHRYTSKFLNGDNKTGNPLDMAVVISGSKKDIHIWQHEQIVDFIESVGSLPILNLSEW